MVRGPQECDFCILGQIYTYGVASMSRMLKNMGLFCKRDLQKRPIFCKETYIFKHPINWSHPIPFHCMGLYIYIYICIYRPRMQKSHSCGPRTMQNDLTIPKNVLVNSWGKDFSILTSSSHPIFPGKSAISAFLGGYVYIHMYIYIYVYIHTHKHTIEIVFLVPPKNAEIALLSGIWPQYGTASWC